MRLVLLTLLIALALPSSSDAVPPPPIRRTKATKLSQAIANVFARLTRALKTRNETLFQAQWHPQGYKANLVGRSGLPGFAVYAQGSRKRWTLKPERSKQKRLAKGVVIVPCVIWSWHRKRGLDHVHALLIHHNKRWLLLGAGERRKEVLALAQRYRNQQPLLPKK